MFFLRCKSLKKSQKRLFSTTLQNSSIRYCLFFYWLLSAANTENKGIRFKATVVNSTKFFFILFPSALSLSLPLSSLPPSPSCCQRVHAVSRAPYLLTTFTFMIPIGNGIQLVWITALGRRLEHNIRPLRLLSSSHTVREGKAFYQQGGDTVK